MTQEELNQLILGNFDNKAIDDMIKEDNISLDVKNPFANQSNSDLIDESNFDVEHYRADADAKWPPPPPTDDYKVIYQLDDVTKDLEVKATEVFDQLGYIDQNSINIQKDSKIIKSHLLEQKKLFEKLSSQFPHIKVFQDSLKSCDESLKKIISINDSSQDISDSSLKAIDIMQYQDIHRQKIERVVNVMRALSKYLNSMFDTQLEDKKRVSSATYLHGDKKNDTISSDEIDFLIASLTNNKDK